MSGDEAEAAVWINPARMGGQPCIYGTRLSVEQVAGIVWEHGVDEVTNGWDVTRHQVLVACWYAVAFAEMYPHQARRGPWRRRWGAWAEGAERWLRGGDETAQDPPQRVTEAQDGAA